MTASLTRLDTIALLNLGSDENRWSVEWIESVNSALDEVVATEPTALVTTGSGKFFSNGLDVDWMAANGDRWGWYVEHIHALLSRMLTLPVPTIAALNGHTFGAGALLAMAHDFRAMRADRGFLCFPEVDIRIPFSPGMAALIQSKVSPQTAVAAMTTGRRYGGADARAAGLVDLTADESALLDSAIGVVAPLVGKDPATLGNVKATMFASAVAALALPLAT